MNDVPHNDEPSDDIDDLYRRAAALDPSRPSERVRDAVLSHAAQLAAERSARATQRRPWYKAPRFVPRRLSTLVGTLAAAVLVGLLVTPRFLLTRDGTPSSDAPANMVSIEPAAVAPPAPLPQAQELQQPYISRPQQRQAAAARARAQAGKEAKVDLDAASTQLNEIVATHVTAAPAPVAAAAAPLAAASAPPVAGAALRRAAEQGDIPKLQALFDLGVDVNARDADDRSALLLAVLNGRNRVVELLLAHSANVNAADRNGTTPLQAAESTHQAAIAATLRAAGAH